MAGLTDVMEVRILELLFENTDAAEIGDATGLRGSSTAGSFFIGLHTADPTDSSTDQQDSEATYTGYARVAVARNSTQWNVTAGIMDNTNAITFPACTASSSTVTHVSVGETSSGAGTPFLIGALDASLAITAGITPSFAAGELNFTID